LFPGGVVFGAVHAADTTDTERRSERTKNDFINFVNDIKISY
jgi:hypothetical protein